MGLGSPKVITTVQCSVCSQLNNKPRVVVTDAPITMVLLSGCYILEAHLHHTRIQPRHNNYKRVREHAHLIHVPMH